MAKVSGNVDYEDPTHVPDSQQYDEENIDAISTEIAEFIRKKMYGVDVRESLARWVEINSAITKFLTNKQSSFTGEIGERQTSVEGRQDSLETEFKNVLANATEDSEVINARDSALYGSFPVLGDRLANFEQLFLDSLPIGGSYEIQHNLNCDIDVEVKYYEYAIGTEPDGLATGPAGSFGGINKVIVPSQTKMKDQNNITVAVPKAYVLNGTPVKHNDGNFYLTEGYKTLKFRLLYV